MPRTRAPLSPYDPNRFSNHPRPRPSSQQSYSGRSHDNVTPRNRRNSSPSPLSPPPPPPPSSRSKSAQSKSKKPSGHRREKVPRDGLTNEPLSPRVARSALRGSRDQRLLRFTEQYCQDPSLYDSPYLREACSVLEDTDGYNQWQWVEDQALYGEGIPMNPEGYPQDGFAPPPPQPRPLPQQSGSGSFAPAQPPPPPPPGAQDAYGQQEGPRYPIVVEGPKYNLGNENPQTYGPGYAPDGQGSDTYDIDKLNVYYRGDTPDLEETISGMNGTWLPPPGYLYEGAIGETDPAEIFYDYPYADIPPEHRNCRMIDEYKQAFGECPPPLQIPKPAPGLPAHNPIYPYVLNSVQFNDHYQLHNPYVNRHGHSNPRNDAIFNPGDQSANHGNDMQETPLLHPLARTRSENLYGPEEEAQNPWLNYEGFHPLSQHRSMPAHGFSTEEDFVSRSGRVAMEQKRTPSKVNTTRGPIQSPLDEVFDTQGDDVYRTGYMIDAQNGQIYETYENDVQPPTSDSYLDSEQLSKINPRLVYLQGGWDHRKAPVTRKEVYPDPHTPYDGPMNEMQRQMRDDMNRAAARERVQRDLWNKRDDHMDLAEQDVAEIPAGMLGNYFYPRPNIYLPHTIRGSQPETPWVAGPDATDIGDHPVTPGETHMYREDTSIPNPFVDGPSGPMPTQFPSTGGDGSAPPMPLNVYMHPTQRPTTSTSYFGNVDDPAAPGMSYATAEQSRINTPLLPEHNPYFAGSIDGTQATGSSCIPLAELKQTLSLQGQHEHRSPANIPGTNINLQGIGGNTIALAELRHTLSQQGQHEHRSPQDIPGTSASGGDHMQAGSTISLSELRQALSQKGQYEVKSPQSLPGVVINGGGNQIQAGSTGALAELRQTLSQQGQHEHQSPQDLPGVSFQGGGGDTGNGIQAGSTITLAQLRQALSQRGAQEVYDPQSQPGTVVFDDHNVQGGPTITLAELRQALSQQGQHEHNHPAEVPGTVIDTGVLASGSTTVISKARRPLSQGGQKEIADPAAMPGVSFNPGSGVATVGSTAGMGKQRDPLSQTGMDEHHDPTAMPGTQWQPAGGDAQAGPTTGMARQSAPLSYQGLWEVQNPSDLPGAQWQPAGGDAQAGPTTGMARQSAPLSYQGLWEVQNPSDIPGTQWQPAGGDAQVGSTTAMAKQTAPLTDQGLWEVQNPSDLPGAQWQPAGGDAQVGATTAMAKQTVPLTDQGLWEVQHPSELPGAQWQLAGGQAQVGSTTAMARQSVPLTDQGLWEVKNPSEIPGAQWQPAGGEALGGSTTAMAKQAAPLTHQGLWEVRDPSALPGAQWQPAGGDARAGPTTGMAKARDPLSQHGARENQDIAAMPGTSFNPSGPDAPQGGSTISLAELRQALSHGGVAENRDIVNMPGVSFDPCSGVAQVGTTGAMSRQRDPLSQGGIQENQDLLGTPGTILDPQARAGSTTGMAHKAEAKTQLGVRENRDPQSLPGTVIQSEGKSTGGTIALAQLRQALSQRGHQEGDRDVPLVHSALEIGGGEAQSGGSVAALRQKEGPPIRQEKGEDQGAAQSMIIDAQGRVGTTQGLSLIDRQPLGSTGQEKWARIGSIDMNDIKASLTTGLAHKSPDLRQVETYTEKARFATVDGGGGNVSGGSTQPLGRIDQVEPNRSLDAGKTVAPSVDGGPETAAVPSVESGLGPTNRSWETGAVRRFGNADASADFPNVADSTAISSSGFRHGIRTKKVVDVEGKNQSMGYSIDGLPDVHTDLRGSAQVQRKEVWRGEYEDKYVYSRDKGGFMTRSPGAGVNDSTPRKTGLRGVEAPPQYIVRNRDMTSSVCRVFGEDEIRWRELRSCGNMLNQTKGHTDLECKV